MAKKSIAVFSLALAIFCLSCTAIKTSTPAIEMKKKEAPGPRTDSFLTNLLAQHPQWFDTVLRNNDLWKVQVIYTQIDRDQDNKPLLKHFFYNVDNNQYFYPASTVKLPAAVLALQRLNELAIDSLDKHSTFITDAATKSQTAVYNDPTSPDGRPTVAHYIKKIFLVSDNDAYNRLYEFLGQEYLNEQLHKMGYDSVQLVHRLQVSLPEEENRLTNPVSFYDTAGRQLYQQPLTKSDMKFAPRNMFLGNGYMQNGKIVNRPFDFSMKNRISLADLHSILQSVMLPETVPEKQRFRLTDDDYRFLYRYLSMTPKESRIPQYDSAYDDAYVKFLLYGGKGTSQNSSVRIFNKVGDAYGFLQDVAYIVDFEKGVEFMLSATIFCNTDGIFNDDKYEYDSVGLPFLKHLGQAVYEYELQRKKAVLPNLDKFRIDYLQR